MRTDLILAELIGRFRASLLTCAQLFRGGRLSILISFGELDRQGDESSEKLKYFF